MSSLSYSELKKGARIILNKQPYEIIESSTMFKGRGHSVFKTKLKNLITGIVILQTFHPSDSFPEAEISKIPIKFLYTHRDKFFFSEKNNPSKRFDLNSEQIGEAVKFLKPDLILEGIVFENKIVNISLPVKMQLKVKSAPPGIKGDRAQGGNKTVVLETGMEINAPLFIKEGDIIEVNTEKGEYTRRIEKK